MDKLLKVAVITWAAFLALLAGMLLTTQAAEPETFTAPVKVDRPMPTTIGEDPDEDALITAALEKQGYFRADVPLDYELQDVLHTAADATWRELTTIRIVDDVIPTVRSALRAKFRRAKNTEQSRGAIRSQVVLELENKLAREIITGYDGVTVTADSENPTVCLVDFSFTVAHGLNQIWLSAHITV